MKDFAAIDFETAIHHHTSVCECHGLTAQDTADAHLFPEVWAEIASQIEEFTLVAHNKEYDKLYLTKCHEHYCMLYSNYIFECIIEAARRSFLSYPIQHIRFLFTSALTYTITIMRLLMQRGVLQ